MSGNQKEEELIIGENKNMEGSLSKILIQRMSDAPLEFDMSLDIKLKLYLSDLLHEEEK